MKNLMPSPTIGLREKIRQRFHMVIVPEWNTTKICHACNGTTSNSGVKIKVKRKRNGKLQEVEVETRDLRRCDNCRRFLNRDRNGALNILRNWT